MVVLVDSFSEITSAIKVMQMIPNSNDKNMRAVASRMAKCCAKNFKHPAHLFMRANVQFYIQLGVSWLGNN